MKVLSFDGQVSKWHAKRIEQLMPLVGLYSMRVSAGKVFFIGDESPEVTNSTSRKEVFFASTQQEAHKLFKRLFKPPKSGEHKLELSEKEVFEPDETYSA